MPPGIRVFVHAPVSPRHEWIESELDHHGALVQVGRTITAVVTALVDDPPPRAQVFVVDFDALSPGEVLELHALRERGWFGAIIALGTVGDILRSSLSIDRVLCPPLVAGLLCETIDGLGLHAVTVRMPTLAR
ncbi:MAG: hypothetical protein H0T79_19930 [Deltaproteobacteria bacterium]|nr:hypothetical protein [Deltaproteobacteria bacterium]